MATGYGVSSTSLNGCVLYFDAANPKSYPGAGTTWLDLSGNNNNGTLTNGPLFNNLYGGCIQTDGVNDYISVAHNSTLNFGTGDFTILMWVSGITGYPGCVPALLWKGANFSNNNAGYSMAWACSAPALYFITADGSTKINFTDNPLYSLNGWTGVKMIGMRRSGGNLYQINNGITTLLGASALNVNNSSTMYFAYDATYNGYLSCKIHAVQMFNRGVSDSELTSIFAVTRNRYFGTLPFAPSDISGLQLWLDADDPRTLYSDTSGTTKATTDGTAVALWVDKSGNGRNASQSTAASRPAIKSAFTNGRNVLNFDGSNDTLTVPSSTSAFKFLHSTTSTVFIVVQYKSPASTYTSYFTTASSTNNVGYLILRYTNDKTGMPYIAGGVGGSWVTVNESDVGYIDNAQFYLVCCACDPTNATAANRATGYKNGRSPFKNNTQTLTPSNANSTYDLAIGSEGGAYFANVYIAEILAYNSLLTASQRIQVETYLNNKWGLWASFNPSSISGLQLWLDSSDSGTLYQDSAGVIPAINDGDPVGYWKDKSGNARHATQVSSLTSRPILKTNIQNGKPAVYFDGSGTWLSNTVYSYSGTTTLFVVASNNYDNGYYFDGAGGSIQMGLARYSSTTLKLWNGAELLTSPIFNLGNISILESVWNTTSSYMAVNGQAGATGTTLAVSLTGYTVGRTRNGSGAGISQGNFCEIILYQGVLTLAQRQQVEQYLNQKWGIF